MHVSLWLLVTNMIFLQAIDVEQVLACQLVTIALHFSLLCTFSVGMCSVLLTLTSLQWMLIMGIHIYRTFIEVFHDNASWTSLVLFGYGVSTISSIAS